MRNLEIKANVPSVNNSLIINELNLMIREQTDSSQMEIKQTEAFVPNTKGLVTTAVAFSFAGEIAKDLTVAMIVALVKIALRKLFSKKQVDAIQVQEKEEGITVYNVEESININIVVEQ